ncbi:LANO_0G11848g1_1 [Lachancea nothofagi CBS 11611]|uniref:LANO_0G11848g1_1 n=1 Tax=Lachancea nothofagi CBS 11611 TaxID=1266666 RepID=A0A1G4KJG6_9SACH|nr:LANO_0G11848g1_1 [Lachancea nothofagi CBS 11611]
MAAPAVDPNEAYRQTQFQIYNLQQTLLNSSKAAESEVAGPTAHKRPEIANGRDDARTNNRPFHDPAQIDSKPVLELVADKFGNHHRRIGIYRYNPWKTGHLADSKRPDTNQEPLDETQYAMPRPFLPAFGFSDINALVTVEVRHEDIVGALQKPSLNVRVANNELWGTQIYTDDSDLLLALIHCHVLRYGSDDITEGILRTPANLSNPDNVTGTLPPSSIAYDLKVDLLLLPPLKKYSSTSSNSVRSRSWATGHDGLSFGIYAVEITARDHSLQSIEPQDEIKSVQW